MIKMNKQKEIEQLNNVFELSPLKHEYTYFGKDSIKEELLYRIVSKSITLIVAGNGQGKTSLLKYIIDNFKGRNKVLYVNANKEYDLKKLLKKRKNMILLLDNVSTLKHSEIERIKYYYDEDIISSIVFTTNDVNSLNFSQSMWSRIGRNMIEIQPDSFEEFKSYMLERLIDKNIFSNESLEIIYQLSSNNKIRLLIAKRVYEYISNLEDKKISETNIQKILKEIEKNFKEKK